MQQNQLFRQTRMRLAISYAGVMGIILSLSGAGMYSAIAHAHQMTLDRELKSVAGTLHDSLEFVLHQPGMLEPEVLRFLPDLCRVGDKCPSDPSLDRWHILGAIQQGNYYVRLFDPSGRVIAVSGVQPEAPPLPMYPETWEVFKDSTGIRYRHIFLPLHTHSFANWGYLQVGRSLDDFDSYLAAVRLILFLGLPLALLFVGGASWVLAEQAMRPIYRSYRQIQQFTGDAAHELRTPLAALRATIESTLSLPQVTETEARTTFKTLDRQTQRLSNLVKDLLLLSRMEQQVTPQKKTKCCLNDLLADLEEELAALALEANVKLHVEIQVKESVCVTGDEAQLYRMAYNLASNAIEYTPAGGEVSVILDRKPPWVLIRVCDTGIGIPPEEQSRIFDRFYRVSQDRSRHTGGSGLGLAIARAIVQLHHGKIEVKSQLNRGSQFTVYLPDRSLPN
jgi:signal transduction histidine kinase